MIRSAYQQYHTVTSQNSLVRYFVQRVRTFHLERHILLSVTTAMLMSLTSDT